jgi:hypothetical protein
MVNLAYQRALPAAHHEPNAVKTSSASIQVLNMV